MQHPASGTAAPWGAGAGLSRGTPGAAAATLHRGALQKTHHRAAAKHHKAAPNPSHREAPAWQCSHMAPEGKFGKKSTFQSNERDVLWIILLGIVWVYSSQ